MIGVGTVGTAALIEQEAALPRESGILFGIGLLGWAIERQPELLASAIDAGPALISVSFSNLNAVRHIQDAGIALATQIYDLEGARRAVGEGADIIVARGLEGGGHGRNEVATLPLLQEVLDSVNVPVLAAGGISSPRGLAAVLAAGASGAWIGTAFLACPETLSSPATHPPLFAARDTDSIFTRSIDVAMGFDWPPTYGERVLQNAFLTTWAGRESALERDAEARAAFVRARQEFDFDVAEIDAGQGVGLLNTARPAAEIVEEFTHEAAALLRRWAVG